MVITMLIKVNNKPLVIKEEPEQDGNPAIHLTMLVTTFFFSLYLLDYVSYLFVGYSPFPIIRSIVTFIGGIIWITFGESISNYQIVTDAAYSIKCATWNTTNIPMGGIVTNVQMTWYVPGVVLSIPNTNLNITPSITLIIAGIVAITTKRSKHLC